MGMPMPAYYSAEMVRALPDDGRRYETIHGELFVTPAPRAWHQEVTFRLGYALRAYLDDNRAGHLFASPADISWAPDVLVQPDLFVVDLEQARTLKWDMMQTLSLAVEVLSPTTARADRFAKRLLYAEYGVPLYWIVDPDKKQVEVWTTKALMPEVMRSELVWAPAGFPPFELALEGLFKPL